MEYMFDEKVSKVKITGNVYWLQDFFNFGSQKRISTVTDVKFVDNNRLIVAHRSAAKIYLIKINGSTYDVLDSLTLMVGGQHHGSDDQYYHPDAITLCNNRIYMTAYRNNSCVLDIVNDKLVFIKLFKIDSFMHYHGCHHNSDMVYFGSVKCSDNNTPLTIYNTKTDKFKNLKTGTNKRIKAISSYKECLLLCMDDLGSHHQPLHNSCVMLYSVDNDKLLYLDKIDINNSQIDGMVIYNDYFLATIHCGIDKCGNIIVGKINNNKLYFTKKVPCNDFPHGIDVFNDKVAYTSYANSSIVIQQLSNFID